MKPASHREPAVKPDAPVPVTHFAFGLNPRTRTTSPGNISARSKSSYNDSTIATPRNADQSSQSLNAQTSKQDSAQQMESELDDSAELPDKRVTNSYFSFGYEQKVTSARERFILNLDSAQPCSPQDVGPFR